jgi:hypothetical protein
VKTSNLASFIVKIVVDGKRTELLNIYVVKYRVGMLEMGRINFLGSISFVAL